MKYLSWTFSQFNWREFLTFYLTVSRTWSTCFVVLEDVISIFLRTWIRLLSLSIQISPSIQIWLGSFWSILVHFHSPGKAYKKLQFSVKRVIQNTTKNLRARFCENRLYIGLTLSWRRPLSYRNQPVHWFAEQRPGHERVKGVQIFSVSSVSYFPVFGLNIRRICCLLPINLNTRSYWTEKTRYSGTFYTETVMLEAVETIPLNI